MSLMFERSRNVWETFTTIGREAGALLVAFDDETGELGLVWPRRGRLGVCILDECVVLVDDEWKSRADLYCEAVLSALAVAPVEPGSEA
jgi:hypothetical protein